MKTVNLDNLLDEIAYLKKSHELLEQACSFLEPYEQKINGRESGFLVRLIHEHLINFDDNE